MAHAHLEGFGLAGHDELERLDRVARELEGHCGLALEHVARPLRQEGHPFRRHRGAVPG